MTIRQKVEELLKKGWYSNFQINMEVKSSSGDREARRFKKFPPIGYRLISRPKRIEGYNSCLEFTLMKEGD